MQQKVPGKRKFKKVAKTKKGVPKKYVSGAKNPKAREKEILRTAKSQMVGKNKEGKHYDFGVGKGSTFILAVDKKLEDEILSLLIQKGVRQVRSL